MRRRIKHAHAYVTGDGFGALIIRSVAGTGAVRIAAMVASFAVGVQLARGLGVLGYGYYGLALSVITIAGIPGELGLPRLVTREVAGAAARKDIPHLFGVLHWADRMAWRISTALAVALVLTALILSHTRPAMALAIGAPIIPLMALSRVRGGALQGLQHVVLGQIPANLLRPACLSLMLFIAFLFGLKLGVSAVMALNVVTAAGAFFIADYWLRQRLPKETSSERVRGGARWLASCIPMALTDGMRLLQSELSILLLGLLASPIEVGLFRVANVTATSAAAGLLIVGHATMPTIAHLHAQGDRTRLQKLVTYSAWMQLAGVSALALPLIFFPGFLLSLAFGSDFASAAWAVRIIAIGQILNAAFGPNVVLLNMTHNERRVTRAMTIALVLNIAIVLLLASVWGENGAALGMLAALLTWNVLAWLDARRILGIETSVIGAIAR